MDSVYIAYPDDRPPEVVFLPEDYDFRGHRWSYVPLTPETAAQARACHAAQWADWVLDPRLSESGPGDPLTEIKSRAATAGVPRHNVEIDLDGDTLLIAVRGIMDDSATHGTTRQALDRVGDAIGIPNDLWIRGDVVHCGIDASIRLPWAAVVAAMAGAGV